MLEGKSTVPIPSRKSPGGLVQGKTADSYVLLAVVNGEQHYYGAGTGFHVSDASTDLSKSDTAIP